MTPRTDEQHERSDRTIWEIDDQEQEIEGLDENGRPDPSYAAALGLLPAPLGRRALALPIDIAIWAAVQLPLWIGAVPLLLKLADASISPYGFLNHPGFVLAAVAASVTVFLTIVLSVVQLALHGRRGFTIGKAVVGIRTVNVRRLERLGIGWVLLRYLLLCAASIVPVIGPVVLLLSPTFDPEGRRRGLHDKATHVWLVDVRQGLNPYDEKRLRVARKLVKAEPTLERSALPSLATPLDPSVQPEYRPGSRVSAGVIGIARPHAPSDRAEIGIAQPVAPVQPTPTELGKPVLGGYRPAEGDKLADRPTGPAAAADAGQPLVEPVSPAPVAPPQPPVPQRFGLRLDTGESIPVIEPLLFGRNPDSATYPDARSVPLEDESKSLSKTHLLVRPVDGGVEITDCGSTNGSGLARAGVEYVVTAGAPVVTVEGDTIRLGDRFAIVVRL